MKLQQMKGNLGVLTLLWETQAGLTGSNKWSVPLNLSTLDLFVNCLLMFWCGGKFWCCLGAYNDYAKILLISLPFFFFCRHGDRTRVFSAPCWDNDNATWDCLLSSASIPVIKHDIHDITVSRLYRDGIYLCPSLTTVINVIYFIIIIYMLGCQMQTVLHNNLFESMKRNIKFVVMDIH